MIFIKTSISALSGWRWSRPTPQKNQHKLNFSFIRYSQTGYKLPKDTLNKSVRPEPDVTTSHPTKQPRDGCQVVGYVEG
ncbi:MAG TPA: hypothetical protein VFW53_07480 [Gallionella sp.]|nr:hypothetical protein [Gallionella sp.]